MVAKRRQYNGQVNEVIAGCESGCAQGDVWRPPALVMPKRDDL